MGTEDEFARTVKHFSAYWQEWRRSLEGARREAERLDEGDQALAALGLWRAAVQERRLWRRYLRHFGYRVLRSGRILAVKRSRGRRLGRHDVYRVTLGMESLLVANALAESTRREGLPGAWSVLDKLPALAGHGMLGLPMPEQRNAAAVVTTGWTRSSLRVFGRMRQCLPKDDARRLIELGTATALGFGEAAKGEDLADIRRRIARLWAGSRRPGKEGSRQPRHDETDGSDTYAEQEDSFAQMAMAEVEVRDLLISAGLSRREGEALRAWLQAETEAEIASTMGVTVGTVRQLLDRAKRKLRAVA